MAVAAFSAGWETRDPAGRTTEASALVPPEGPVLLVNNQGSGTTTMIEVGTGRLVAHIPVGEGPHEIAASPDGRRAVVTLPGDSRASIFSGNLKANKLAVIDVATASLSRVIDLGGYTEPHGIVFLGDGRTVAVTSEPRHAVVFVDVETGVVVKALPVGADAGPYLVAASGDGQRLFTANLDSRSVGEIDVTTRRLRRTLAAPGVPEGIDVSPDGGTIWLVESLASQILAVLDARTGATLATFGGFAHPHRVGLSPDGAVALVTDLDTDEIRVYDVRKRRELARISTGAGTAPSGVSFTPDATRAYVSLSGGGVVELDLSSRSVLRRFENTQRRPDGVVYIPR